MKKGQSITAKNGKLRIKYDPEWSPSMPFCTYENGTAGRSFGSLTAATNYFSNKNGQVNHRWSDFK